jgi:hypothetical protein
VRGTGSVLVRGTGSVLVRGTGSVLVRGTGSVLGCGSASGEVAAAGASASPLAPGCPTIPPELAVTCPEA